MHTVKKHEKNTYSVDTKILLNFLKEGGGVYADSMYELKLLRAALLKAGIVEWADGTPLNSHAGFNIMKHNDHRAFVVESSGYRGMYLCHTARDSEYWKLCSIKWFMKALRAVDIYTKN